MSTNPVLEFVDQHADEFAATAAHSEKLGKLDDSATRLLRESGVMRMLAPKQYSGAEAHPVEFAETVMRLASLDGSLGWVAGIVGVHPWELAMADKRVQNEVWGEDHNVWLASPYAPMGILRPVDGGYIFNGHWQFSSGTDHCDWIFLGAWLGDESGEKLPSMEMIHVLLPRSDYEIVENSWDVVGLRGTGSKDIIVKDAFIPDYRVIEFNRLMDGSQVRDAGLENPTFHVPYTTIFPLGISAAVIGICEGALAHHLDYQRDRVQIVGTAVRDDPYVLSTIGGAAAEIHASRVTLLDNVSRIYDKVDAGEEITFADRAQSRRTQVSAAWRAVRAMDEIVARSGGNGLRMAHPLQRFWRDGHMGLAHAIHVPGSVLHASALASLDIVPPPGPLTSMI
ncbi:acyl-CoA dehydrogenase family protein [Hoyosella altamirensis]|uniref:Alkylation response protein AidB-like acyl-CoA dehydrogenase n=1 Tax=Hoyosella altamirensis TaxID=616997 RepID=A0A839RQZ2_9ACTN|nr:acyl-CoA dehydrogenase family protein [Hoyosella altamirensis]MBB3039235.1 alkylation response protein AidB-like acyl-CoA dehydrogenase [Hoyosella altamirensis]